MQPPESVGFAGTPPPVPPSAVRSVEGPAPGFKLANLVLQGGGTLGIAHVGAVTALEERGYRFVGLAGASAGAIAAMLMAASRDHVGQPCGPGLRDLLMQLPASDFVDGPARVRRFIKRLVPPRKPGLEDLYLLPGCLQALRTLSRRRGLNSGDAFSFWLGETLKERYGVGDGPDLRAKVKATAKSALGLLDHQPREEWLDPGDYLALTATALPLGLRLILPRHLPCFSEGVQGRGPAEWVRASMSVPGFFEPVSWPLGREEEKALWRHPDFRPLLEPRDETMLRDLESLALVDGGLLSNFPVDAFSEDFLPPGHPIAQLPTFGLLLSQRPEPHAYGRGLRAVGQGVAQMVGAARASRDREALARMMRRRRYEERDGQEPHRLFRIDPGEHNWLDFSLPTADMEDLYARGRAAVDVVLAAAA